MLAFNVVIDVDPLKLGIPEAQVPAKSTPVPCQFRAEDIQVLYGRLGLTVCKKSWKSKVMTPLSQGEIDLSPRDRQLHPLKQSK